MKPKTTIVFFLLIQVRRCFFGSEHNNYGIPTQPFSNYAGMFYEEDQRQTIEGINGIFATFSLIINIWIVKAYHITQFKQIPQLFVKVLEAFLAHQMHPHGPGRTH